MCLKLLILLVCRGGRDNLVKHDFRNHWYFKETPENTTQNVDTAGDIIEMGKPPTDDQMTSMVTN